jgi:assimilatory nitrate reductase catalytic subunit
MIAPDVLRQFDGPLTADLVQRPGAFGLGQVPVRLAPDSTAAMVCGFCSTGCGLQVHLRGGQAVNLSADPRYPVNLGLACPKGWEALTPLASPDRATTPLLRRKRGGELEPVDWDEALQVFTLRFKALLDQHGPESVAWLGTGQIPSEELAFLGALGKFGMGLRHGDGNTRQCMATSAVAYKQSFGFDAPPFSYADFEQSDVLVFVGSNLCVAHPILWQRVLRNPNRPEIIVIDPRKTETALAATRHLALRPKSDLILLYGLAHLLIRREWVDRDFVAWHTTGFAEFAEFARAFPPARVTEATGLAEKELLDLAETIHRGKAVSFWWTMGVNQGHEATRTAQAIINLALLTGNIGRPGTGANSITGQCNAMGSRLFSNTTNLLGGHEFTNAADREKIARTLGLPADAIPPTPSWSYDQILDGVDRGVVKGLWVVATNTAHSWIGKGGKFGAAEGTRGAQAPSTGSGQANQQATLLERSLGKLEFLVVQDMYADTATARLADLVLPAAGWGEKEGTFINSERRIGVIKKVARAPGQALADFHIFRLIAHYWGCDGRFREWTSPQAVFQILKRCSAGQPCDITGIEDYRHLEECGGVQWPWPVHDEALHPALPADSGPPAGLGKERARFAADSTERRLFEDGRFFTPDGKARFIFEAPRPVAEPPDAEYPFVLLTGRGSSAQWHTLTRTDRSEILRKLGPAELQVEIHPDDARRLGLKMREWVRVISRRGEAVASALITATVGRGQVFLPMHGVATNALTLAVFDPYSRQPSYKHCAVRIERHV